MLTTILRRIPPFAQLIALRHLVRNRGFVPPGHFYSPVIAIDEVRQDEHRIFGASAATVAGIDMNEAAQLDLLARFEAIYPSIDFPATRTAGHRFHYENPAYGYSDAILLHCMLRHFRPRRIIEVGSGYSSCMILDTREKHLPGLDVTFVEPYPELLMSLLQPKDRETIEIIPKRVQDVPLDVFRQLQAGDFLFIDSTHVSKTGSDVNYLMFDVLPALNAGVHIHIHDVFFPFEYPMEWVLGGRSWNEQYVLRAFLQYNAKFSITMMNTYLQRFHRERFAAGLPLCLRNTGGSLWITKH
jgi:hypothetical protein